MATGGALSNQSRLGLRGDAKALALLEQAKEQGGARAETVPALLAAGADTRLLSQHMGGRRRGAADNAQQQQQQQKRTTTEDGDDAYRALQKKKYEERVKQQAAHEEALRRQYMSKHGINPGKIVEALEVVD